MLRTITNNLIKRSILLADDHGLVAEAFSILLEQTGQFTVTVVHNLMDAKAAIVAHGEFDLVLLDVMMPTLDGLQALAQWRAHERALGVHTPIVMVTAHAMLGDEEKMLAAGADGYVSKPVDLKALSAVIGKVCHSPTSIV